MFSGKLIINYNSLISYIYTHVMAHHGRDHHITTQSENIGMSNYAYISGSYSRCTEPRIQVYKGVSAIHYKQMM
jgi:hypothetical protein